MWPIANAIVSTVRPNASATPRKPIPTLGNPAASTAAPQPPNTSQKVPINSAVARFEIGILTPFTTKLEYQLFVGVVYKSGYDLFFKRHVREDRRLQIIFVVRA